MSPDSTRLKTNIVFNLAYLGVTVLAYATTVTPKNAG